MKYELVDMVNDYDSIVADGIVDMWITAGVLPKEVDPVTRLEQVKVAALDETGNVVGVNTAYPHRPNHGVLMGALVYPMRQFIRPPNRNFELSRKMLWMSFSILEQNTTDGEGVILVLENLKLYRKGYKKRYRKIGFVELNTPHMEQTVLYKPFGTKLGEPLPEDLIATFQK